MSILRTLRNVLSRLKGRESYNLAEDARINALLDEHKVPRWHFGGQGKSETVPMFWEGYHQFGENKLAGDIKGDIEPYGSFEVFKARKLHKAGLGEFYEFEQNAWYWWACLPGCLPDGDHHGPFETAQEAYEDAQEDA